MRNHRFDRRAFQKCAIASSAANRNKAGGKLIRSQGVIAVNQRNIEKYRDKPFPAYSSGTADMN